jgi:hypothetical protein
MKKINVINSIEFESFKDLMNYIKENNMECEIKILNKKEEKLNFESFKDLMNYIKENNLKLELKILDKKENNIL